MRLASDAGGTFTDLVVGHGDDIRLFKAFTAPDDPLVDALQLAADHFGLERSAFLKGATMFVPGTTRAINAILTGHTARTAFLTTEGHPATLATREGGRMEPFDFRVPYPKRSVPSPLAFEVPERIDAEGRVVTVFDDAMVLATEGPGEGAFEVVTEVNEAATAARRRAAPIDNDESPTP